jgi:hypothetical protein
MGDFVQHTDVKSAVRTLANPIADIAAFDALVQSVITSNPFGCVAYMVGTTGHQPVEKAREAYTSRIVYTDANAKSIGTNAGKYSSVAGFNAGSTALLADAANTTAHGGTPARDFAADTYSATLRCRDPNGELYDLTFTRGQLTLGSYTDDAIRARVETWADSVPALA